MKNLLALITAVLVSLVMIPTTMAHPLVAQKSNIAQTQEAIKQTIWVQYCCDTAGYRRCVIPQSPYGVACYCYGVSGTGWACP